MQARGSRITTGISDFDEVCPSKVLKAKKRVTEIQKDIATEQTQTSAKVARLVKLKGETGKRETSNFQGWINGFLNCYLMNTS